MFSQYVDGTFHPLGYNQQHSTSAHTKENTTQPAAPTSLQGEFMSGISNIFGSIGKHFSLSQIDAGDILLALIILFLFLEGDNLELVITLGLMLLLGFHDDQST